ncbi:hypothetical protein [Methanococcoides sp. FTZ1]|uniref:hypothetical protein n=1 Tax=Methanococcoides sp. FTZ1 TaxID=3439061 RepID=UPI003F830D16
MADEKNMEQKPKVKQDQDHEQLEDEDLDELMVRTARSQIRSDYRRSLGCENSRRCMDLHKNKKDD